MNYAVYFISGAYPVLMDMFHTRSEAEEFIEKYAYWEGDFEIVEHIPPLPGNPSGK